MTEMNAAPDPIEQWLALPFPRGSTNDALDIAHAELATIDSWIAGSVLRYRKTAEWVPPAADVAIQLSQLRATVSAMSLNTFEEREKAASYLHYIDLLSSVYDTFLNWGGQGVRKRTMS